MDGTGGNQVSVESEGGWHQTGLEQFHKEMNKGMVFPGRGKGLTRYVVSTLGQTWRGTVGTLHGVSGFKILKVLEFFLLKVWEVTDQQHQHQ